MSTTPDSPVQDLSLEHQPISELLEIPTSDEAWDAYRLSEEQVAFFHENGYVAGIKVLNEKQLEQLRAELEGLIDPAHPANHLFHEYHSNESDDQSKVLFHALGAWRTSPGFHDLIFHPAVTMAASQLLGGSVRFWHDQLFCKPAQHGGVVAWHQDFSYWTRTKPMAHLTCWIGLDDADRANGCVQYIPKSHRWDLLPITGLAGDMDAIREVLTEDQAEQFNHPVAIELKQGEATFHHPLLIHGSQENSTNRRRRATVLNMFRDGTMSDTNEPLLEGAPVVPQGQPLDGQFFPLIFKA